MRKVLFTVAVVILLAGCKKEFITQKESSVLAEQINLVSKKPNIILFIADDFGYELPGFTGGNSYNTPNLDSMAANGMLFPNTFSHPDGFPSRLAILTGKYNFRNYLFWGVLPEGEKTIGNLMKDAGYQTCFLGKWQMDGGDARIKSAGFDSYLTYAVSGFEQRYRRYKNPRLYTDGRYVSESVVAGKYSEDLLHDYFSHFVNTIDSSKPFFVVYSHLLPGKPWVPTPDNPEFATWDPLLDSLGSNKKYFPEMVEYLDKKIGQVVQKVRSAGLEDNTIFMFVGDNATDTRITSIFKGDSTYGTKTTTTRAGTITPFVAYGPGRIQKGGKSFALVDFTDFLCSLAAMAEVPVPSTYGILDGVNFYDDLVGTPTVDRSWVFCHWDNNMLDGGAVPAERWVNNVAYKLYDTVGLGNGRFYRTKTDLYELSPLADDSLTADEIQIKNTFKNILNTMHN